VVQEDGGARRLRCGARRWRGKEVEVRHVSFL